MFQRAGKIKDVAGRAEWSMRHTYCACCGHSGTFGRWLECHHLCGGAGRSDEPCNYLRLCNRCHMLAEGHQIRENGVVLPNLSMGATLWLKRFVDPDEYKPERLAELLHENLPDLEVPPAILLTERLQRRPWEPLPIAV